MPQNPVTDAITDQEIAFAHLVLSGTMDDSRAAKAAGLNPSTAADIKGKPRVHAYIAAHRAAVSQKLVDQDAEESPNLNLSRDPILARLWELANLDPEQTRGSIAGQIKAMAMIVAIAGLIPNRHRSPAQPAAPPPKPNIYVSAAMRRPLPPESREPVEALAGVEAQPVARQVPQPVPAVKPLEDTTSPDPHRNPIGADNPVVYPKAGNGVPEASGRAYGADLNPAGPHRLPFSSRKGGFARGR